MAHSAIIGMTESGKTTLAKELAKNFKKRKIGVLVLDALNSDWPADFVTDDQNKFLEICGKSRNCALFIDESGDYVGQYMQHMNVIATRSRHYGHFAHFIGQRYKMINTTVRDQCRFLYAFTTSVSNAKIMAEDFAKPIYKDAAKLDQFEYLFGGRYHDVERHRIIPPWQGVDDGR